ncbi:FAD synthase-like [Uloborus diversus]|uniref:FAD synthase-like n=1 Tax=Uloborus diversus TaxID=327109 RepID=UPI00240A2551|nr:FAD synthase-like [Uloborus diversus]
MALQIIMNVTRLLKIPGGYVQQINLTGMGKRFFSEFSSEITAGVAIIGNEILKGITEDINTAFLIKNLNSAGIKVKKVVILPDELNVISKEILELSSSCSVVLTSGGIGPTHDDVTYEAVAKACDENLCLNKELSNLYSNYFGTGSDQNPAIVKFASIPSSAVLNFGEFKLNDKSVKYPLISVRNIYMLPGVPMLLQKSFEIFKSSFVLRNKPCFVRSIYLTVDEFSVTPLLNKVVNEFKDKVQFGSYPIFNDNYHKVKFVLEGSEEHSVKAAEEYIRNNLPNGSIIDRKENALLSAKEDVYAYARRSSAVASAISFIEETLEAYKLSEICFCFNGGKDCTALLHLLYACVQKQGSEKWHQMQTLYVKSGDTFNEVDKFVRNTINLYSLNVTIIEGDLKEATIEFLKKNPQLKIFCIGTRRCDPGAEALDRLCPTDSGWPAVMRMLPLLDWSYKDIWTFLRDLQIPYCSLYDRGYTSLGDRSRTMPNPALVNKDKNGRVLYKPAYMLENESSERNNRC